MEKKFKAFDKVLVKRHLCQEWMCDMYSHYNENSEKSYHSTLTLWEVKDEDIPPYEGNEHLVGTTDEPDEEIKLEKGEKIICNNDVNLLIQGVGFLTTLSYIHGDTFYTGKSRFVEADYNYAIKFCDFNSNDMEETKKHILCVKNGKIIRYKG